MKLVHSYVPTSFNGSKIYPVIWKELMYGQLLSVLLAKREYGNISFYTNEDIAKQVLDIGIPYDEINTEVLGEVKSNCYTYPKMKFLSQLTEPCMHIDTDTYIFDRIDFSTAKTNTVYAHADQPFDLGYANDTKMLSEFITNVSEVYTSLATLHEDQLKDINPLGVDLMKIPNGCITYINNPEVFRQATNLALDYYYKNQSVIDSLKYGGVYVEQMVIHLYLMKLDPEYKIAVERGDHLLSMNRFMTIGGEYFDKETKTTKYTFPFKFKINLIKDDFKPEIASLKNELTEKGYSIAKETSKEVTIENKEQLADYFRFGFYGVHHPSFNKWDPIFECLTIGYIVENFGEEWLQKVHRSFTKFYVGYELPALSRGEKLYEEITGYKFNKINNVL